MNGSKRTIDKASDGREPAAASSAVGIMLVGGDTSKHPSSRVEGPLA